jgi:hypothetical protein
MSTAEERLKILEMIREGRLNAEEGARLLQALHLSAKKGNAHTGREPRWLRVRVTDLQTSKTTVNVNLPMSLVNVGVRMGARFVPKEAEFDAEQVMEHIKAGFIGKVVDMETNGEHVEVWVE